MIWLGQWAPTGATQLRWFSLSPYPTSISCHSFSSPAKNPSTTLENCPYPLDTLSANLFKSILSIVEFFNSGENKKINVNDNMEKNEKGEEKEEDLVEELFKKLINARNIINFLLEDKKPS